MKRVFYVIDFPDPKLQTAFDAIRSVCNPREKHRAHITVRGPYKQRYHLPAADERIQGSLIEIDGPDAFFGDGQNTVFLQCKSESLRDVWKKTDFEFNPHLTLYDGESRDFAKRLLVAATEAKLHLTFIAQRLALLVSPRGQKAFGPAIHLTDDDLTDTFGEHVRLADIIEMDDDTRLRLVGQGLRRLSASEIAAPPRS